MSVHRQTELRANRVVQVNFPVVTVAPAARPGGIAGLHPVGETDHACNPLPIIPTLCLHRNLHLHTVSLQGVGVRHNPVSICDIAAPFHQTELPGRSLRLGRVFQLKIAEVGAYEGVTAQRQTQVVAISVGFCNANIHLAVVPRVPISHTIAVWFP